MGPPPDAGRREADAAKRLALEAAGFHVVVVTWTQVTHETAATAAALLAVLQAAQAA
jgi:very-short-patch-repair endonuclease